MRKLATPLMGLIICTWIGRFIWDSLIWETLENISLGSFAILMSVIIAQDVKESNREKKACSKLMEQIVAIFPSKLEREAPFKNIGIMGLMLGGVGIVLIINEILKAVG